MKSSLLVCLMLALAVAPAAAQTDETPIVLHKPNEAEMAAARAEYARMQNSLPLEQREVAYLIVDKSSFSTTPAFIDLSTSTAYKWKDVVLQSNQVPNLIGTRSGSGLIVPVDPQQSGYRVKEIDPPIRYVALGGSGKYEVGYYDPNHDIFYRWGNLEFDRNELPADAERKNLILAATAIANSSTITPPSKYSPPGTTAPSHSSTTVPPPTSYQTSPANSVSVAPASTTSSAQVQSISETTGIPPWRYGIIMLSSGVILGAGYYLSKRSGKGP